MFGQRTSGRWRVALALGPVVSLSWVGAFAAFTDSVDVTGDFSTGTVEIRANDATGTVAFTSLSMSDMTPGATKFAALKISSTGTAPFEYAMTTTTTGSAPLAAALVLGVRVVAGPACTQAEYDASSSTLYGETAGLTTATFSDRPLAPAASEVLCFKVRLPQGADNTLQGLATRATFTFTAST